MDTFRHRFPQINEVIPVYATIVFIIYSWTTLIVLLKLPSWLKLFPLGEIIGFFAYIFPVCFIDSLFLLSLIIFFSFILPRKFFRSQFIVRGSMMAIILTVWAETSQFITNFLLASSWVISYKLIGLIAILAVITIILFTYLAGKIAFLNKMILTLADGFIIFLYLWLPFSMGCFILLIIRNIS